MEGLYNEWFALADADRDGVISGREAVEFFRRSGLQKRTLAQVWELASTNSQNKGFLNRTAFFAALRLIAYAQNMARGNPNFEEIRMEQGRAIVFGTDSFNEIPLLQGLQIPPSLQSKAVRKRSADFTSYGSQAAAPQMRPAGPDPFKISQEDYTKYQQLFSVVDQDRDGYVKGGECFGLFMESGLQKAQLKAIWSLVAGNNGQLTLQEFVLCEHLIKHCLSGGQLMDSLPPGGFPLQVVQQPSALQRQPEELASAASAAGPSSWTSWPQATAPLSQEAAPLPMSMPVPVPAQSVAPAPQAPQLSPLSEQFEYLSTIPQADFASLDHISSEDKRRLDRAKEEAMHADEQRQKLEQQQAAAKKNAEAYRTAMQDLVMFKSRADAEGLQIGSRLASLSAEVEQCKRQYEHMQEAHAGVEKGLEAQREGLRQLQVEKTNLDAEIVRIGAELAAPEDPSAIASEQARAEAEVTELRVEVAEARRLSTERRQKAQYQLAKAEYEKKNMRKELEDYRIEGEAASADLAKGHEELARVRQQAQEVLSQAKVERDKLARVLGDAGKVFHVLCQAALRHGLEIPSFEPLRLDWSQSLANDAASFEESFTDQGFTVLSAKVLEEAALASPVVEGGMGGSSFRAGVPITVTSDVEAAGDLQSPSSPSIFRDPPSPSLPPPASVSVGHTQQLPANAAEVSSGASTQRTLASDAGSDFGMQNFFASAAPTSRTDLSEAATSPASASARSLQSEPISPKVSSAAVTAAAPPTASLQEPDSPGGDWVAF